MWTTTRTLPKTDTVPQLMLSSYAFSLILRKLRPENEASFIDTDRLASLP